jgi:hypothetical protein
MTRGAAGVPQATSDPAMTLKLAGSAPALTGRLADLSWIFWAILAAALMAATGISSNIDLLRVDYADSDDALRMVQVRELMAHGHWFDTTLPRLGGPAGMLSHWSRLLDLPLAMFITMLSWFLPVPSAELATRLIWPYLLLAPLIYLVARTVEAASNRVTASIAVILLLACPSALVQFTAGRIDHHNVQNLGAVGAVLLLWSIGRLPHAGRWAGLSAGLALAIGYEALPLVLVTTLAAGLWALADRDAAPGVRDYGLALATTIGLAVLATTAPARWLDVRCDALSFNLVLLLGAGALGLAAAVRQGGQQDWRLKWGLATAGGLIGLGLYALVQPVCLAGPMAQVPAGLHDIWLVNVSEAKGWLWFLGRSPPGGVSIAVTFGLGLAAQIALVRRDRTAAHQFYLAVLIVAVTLGFWQIKYLPYPSLLVIAPIAIVIGGLRGTAATPARVVKAAAVLAVNQWCLILTSAVMIPLLTGLSSAVDPAARGDASVCYHKDNIAALAALPAGLMFAPVDLGAQLLAETPHSVLAAPYHRIGPAILETHAILSTKSIEEAERRVAATGARYVLICSGFARLVTPVEDHPGTFYARLKRGEPMPFLSPVAMPAGSPFTVWRVRG